MPATSLSALIETTRWRRSQLKNSRSATASASAPAGLCAPSNRIVGLRETISRRPGQRTPSSAARIEVSSRGPSTKASSATIAAAAFRTAYSPNIGRYTSS